MKMANTNDFTTVATYVLTSKSCRNPQSA